MGIAAKEELFTYSTCIDISTFHAHVHVHIHVHVCELYNNWRAGASQPSRTNGTIFLYILFISMSPALHIP